MAEDKIVKTTTPDEWELWVIKTAFDIGINTYRTSGGNFGSPMLFGLSSDLATHHAQSLMFWSNQSKEDSMRRVRDIVKHQDLVACAFLTRSEVKNKDTARPAMALVVRSFGKPARMIVREILQNGQLGQDEEYQDVDGRLTKFWDNPISGA